MGSSNMGSCKIIKKWLLNLDIGGHGDCSRKLFGGHKHCCDSQWWSIFILVLDKKKLFADLFSETCVILMSLM